jgi:hypothetical protein
MMFLMIFGSILTGTLLSKGFWFAPLAFLGGILVIIGSTLMYTMVEVDTNASPIYGYSVLIALGCGLFTQGPISVVQSLFPAERIADATAFVGFGQVAGIAIMLAVANAIFLNQATNGIQALLPDIPLSEVQGAIQGVGSELFRNINASQRASILQSVVGSMNTVYILIIVAGAVTAVLCPLLKRPQKSA